MVSIIVLIPTKDRAQELEQALESVRHQTRSPDQLVVVYEQESDVSGVKENDWPDSILFCKNSRSHNLSGAVNHGIQMLLTRRFEWDIDPESTYLALLDDDDWWDDNYLEQCLAAASETKADLVVSGIRRYDQEQPDGWELPIPKSLSIDDFLVGNPNIQGSNLFVRLSCFLRAGAFDEHLESTTDRDFCIRLFEANEVKVATINQYLVHHNAREQGRLSDRGNPRKAASLRAFADKHQPRMTLKQRQKFTDRSLQFFSIDPFAELHDDDDDEDANITIHEEEAPEIEYELTLAATIMNKARAASFLAEVDSFMQGFGRPWRMVVVLYQCSKADFVSVMKKHPDLAGRTIIHRTEDFDVMADHGMLGPWLKAKERRIGIALGRTILHRAVLEASIKDSRPVAWILDDDMLLSGLQLGIPPARTAQKGLDRYVRSLLAKGISVGIGTILGDPAIPAINTLRVQLLDLNQSLLGLLSNEGSKPKTSPKDLPDWYYDLSTKHTDHLEWPMVHTLGADPISMSLKILQDLRRGVANLRCSEISGVSHPWYDTDKMATRGGNTLVLDTECLRLYPNISPIIQDNALRRSDTLWTILNQRLGGRIIGHERKKVCYVPVHLPHNRRVYEEIRDPVSHLREDVLGSGITRALDTHFQNFDKFEQFSTTMSEEIASEIVDEAIQFSQQRNARLIGNLYRVTGLLDAVATHAQSLDDNEPLLTELERLRRWIAPSLDKIWRMNFNEDDAMELSRFVQGLPSNIEGFRIQQPYSVGLVRYLEEVGVNSKTTILDPALYELLNECAPTTILDYGCGMGELALTLANHGHEIVGYDVDEELIASLRLSGDKVQFIDPEQLKGMKEQGLTFKKIVCSLVLCTIEDDEEVHRVLKDLRSFSTDQTELIVAVCNPEYISVKETESHLKLDLPITIAGKFTYQKKLKSLGTTRPDVYRPLSVYRSMFEANGLYLQETYDTPATNLADGTPASDFMIIRLRPLPNGGDSE